ncbi:sugar acetyltransferase [Brevibacillus formosus]|uniref:acetyltransferase n=1 Tax=Brevibacillus formosus TaxID=54913 RepID=UPI001C66331E|nr:acetyltransferase [Brevibacillus formosus]MBW5468698.1 sugar acetyltransferase [Brevibacillus formosus]
MKPLIVLGGGGHAKVAIEVLHLLGHDVIGFTDPHPHNRQCGYPCLGDDQVVNDYHPEGILLVNGLGSVGDNSRRKSLFSFWKEKGYTFATIIHPSAILSPDAILEEGVQVMAGAVVQAGARIGANTILNTRATIDHDTTIGRHVHIAPGSVLSGNVTLEDDVHIGTGAVVIQGLTVGKNSIVGAGAVVVNNVPRNATVIGVPARMKETKQPERCDER